MKKHFSLIVSLFAVLMLAAMTVHAQDVKVVSIMVTFGGTELDALRVSTDEFTKQTGVQVSIESNRQLIPILNTRIAGGSPPDTALVPQPGNVATFAKAGSIKPLVKADGTAGLVDPKLLSDNYADGIVSLAKVDGAVYGILAKANSKSTIWYKPAEFKSLGVEVPKTWDELMAIQAKLVAAGKTPWSIGGGSGWPLTDWFENIYVRVAGPDMYQKLFVTHEIPWTDPSVAKAMDYFKQIVDPATNLAGGADGTNATDFQAAANLVFRPDAQAELYYEGGFMGGIIAAAFPDLKPIDDFSAFLFPSIDPQFGQPVVGGGDILVAFADRPEVAQFIQWMAGTEGNTLWAKQGTIVSPNKNVTLDTYSPLAQLDAGEVANATTFVFDGSDLAPSAVGNAMSTALQNFIADPSTATEQLQSIEDAAAGAYTK